MSGISPVSPRSPRSSIERTASQQFRRSTNAITERCRTLWNNLLARQNRVGITLGKEDVGENVADVICPFEGAVNVEVGANIQIGSNEKRNTVFVHANQIQFAQPLVRSATDSQDRPVVRTAIAGQSPQEFRFCERFLIHGLESGNGLFQFVSRKAHAYTKNPSKERSRESSILDQLLGAWKNKKGAALLIANRFDLYRMEKIALDEDSDHCCYELYAKDCMTGEPKTMLITQAGLKFTEKVLKPREIQRASTLMDMHKQRQSEFNQRIFSTPQLSSDRQPDPTVISYAGIGRNATLIAYREALLRTGDSTDNALADIISRGRRDRGPRFVHSAAQLQALQEAVDLAKDANRPTRPTAAQFAASRLIP
jgi:hypothetical protein